MYTKTNTNFVYSNSDKLFFFFLFICNEMFGKFRLVAPKCPDIMTFTSNDNYELYATA